MAVRRYFRSVANWFGWKIDEARTGSIELNLADMYKAVEIAKVRTVEFGEKNSRILGQLNLFKDTLKNQQEEVKRKTAQYEAALNIYEKSQSNEDLMEASKLRMELDVVEEQMTVTKEHINELQVMYDDNEQQITDICLQIQQERAEFEKIRSQAEVAKQMKELTDFVGDCGFKNGASILGGQLSEAKENLKKITEMNKAAVQSKKSINDRLNGTTDKRKNIEREAAAERVRKELAARKGGS